MTTHHRQFGRAGFGITALGAVAASLVLAAPQASAWVGNLAVAGTDHKVGCSYKLTASVEVDRLTSVKRRLDPDNFLRGNYNVAPSAVR